MRLRLFSIAAGVSLILGVTMIGFVMAGKPLLLSMKITTLIPREFAFGFDGNALIFRSSDVPSDAQIASAIAKRKTGWIDPSRSPLGHDPSTARYFGPIYIQHGNVRLIAEVAALFWNYVSPPLGTYRMVAFSVWFVIAALAILPVIVLCGLLSQREATHKGRCRHCSYDLTGNASGVCPECGITIKLL